MDRPVFLSRGRGRGRGNGGRAGPGAYSPTNPYPPRGRGFVDMAYPQQDGQVGARRQNSHGSVGARSSHSSVSDDGSTKSNPAFSAHDRFEDVVNKHQQSVQRHLITMAANTYESSSDEDDLNDEGIMDSMLKTFKSTGDMETDSLGSTQEYLLSSMRPKANVCLICIETVHRNDPIWSCQGCYTLFHITCIQKWVKDGIYQQTLNDETINSKTINWNCPKCRHEYPQAECPTRYYCFCGKEEDPVLDPWLVPHSCGQTCEKQLKAECGHRCLLLCHPGPCPPCPQTVRVTCHCGQQPPQTRRCGAKEWSCRQPCGKPLACGHHTCQTPCHPADCPPCPQTSEQGCQCGKNSSLRPCASPTWQCQQVCSKTLSCGNHTCEKVCHAGECGTCPRAGKRTCPCGKSVFELPCTEDVPTCVDTCGKMLECGKHRCTQRCHTGPCGTCRMLTLKSCRCGQRKKEVPCFKDYTCDLKCSKMKDCTKHPCKRKCCNGDCPPCEQQCNKLLGCHNHKCSSRCHRGPCYPCPKTVTIACSCGSTTVTVPCGRERVTKPPKCNLMCKNPPDCHHEKRDPHRCHFGTCPPCTQTCDKALPACEHSCPAKCHTAVLTKIQEKPVQRAGPWEPKPETKMEVVKKPCPPCIVPVSVSCLGNHEVVLMPCSTASVRSCHRQCGRQLKCGNHYCELECHKVENALNEITAGDSCQKCENGCLKPRPDGCSHPCLLPCHPGECPRCKQMIRMRCHCSLVVRYIECYVWTDASDRERQKLKACPSRCPKMLPCNHQCTAFCHPGPCPSPEKCTDKVKLRCPCRTRKKEFVCNEVQSGYAKVECDEVCRNRKQKQQKEQEEKEKQRKEEEEKRRKEEFEEFERKMKGRKRKPRKQKHEEREPTFFEKNGRRLVVGSMLMAFLAILLYYMFMRDGEIGDGEKQVEESSNISK